MGKRASKMGAMRERMRRKLAKLVQRVERRQELEEKGPDGLRYDTDGKRLHIDTKKVERRLAERMRKGGKKRAAIRVFHLEAMAWKHGGNGRKYMAARVKRRWDTESIQQKLYKARVLKSKARALKIQKKISERILLHREKQEE